MRIHLVGMVSAVLVLGSIACNKGGDDNSESSGGTTDRYNERYGDTVPIDCAEFAARVGECTDAFIAGYADTDTARTSGSGDGAAGAERFRGMLGLNMAERHCSEQYSHRDLHWHHRYRQCDQHAECAPWGPCAANALGNPIGPPDLD